MGIKPMVVSAKYKQILISGVLLWLFSVVGTTLVALIMAAILVFLQNLIQGREENTLNRSCQYCLDNLINRLYSP